MKLVERFLNSGVYIALVFLFVGIAWSFYEVTPPDVFNPITIYGIFWLTGVMFLILIFFENTMYIAPLLMGYLFIINKSDMDLSTTVSFVWIYIVIGLLVLGPVIHIIRFKPKFKKSKFALGLTLIAFSYVLNLFFIPFDIENIPVSMMGFIYLGFYLLLTASVKGQISYIFKLMLFMNLLMTFELGFYIYQGFISHPELAFADRLFVGWGRNLGWANVNDMCFYIALTFPAYMYFIYKHPWRNMFLWGLMILPLIVVFLSESRGGLIGFAISFMGVMIFNLVKGHRIQLVQMLLFIAVTGYIFYVNQDAVMIWWDKFVLSFGEDINDFSSNRIEIYLQGLDVFKAHPIFGGGWKSLQDLNPGTRLFMYHSTIVQSLAAMGIFGFVALMVHYVQVLWFFLRSITLEKSLFMIGYVASQIHGLIDNVQYAVPYSLLIVIFLAIWEKSNKTTDFDMKHHRYQLIEA